ncbi:hypothetical protein RRG08_023541 [Elysia crispata]|uniref:EGF-like domain-containing protein n=1 Tax=Elysia crispata TaxID=231223 RepID=A0AAE1EGF1_9GAST|nr:hypothetical protein RRG08_023541 [Elysia crispata]
MLFSETRSNKSFAKAAPAVTFSGVAHHLDRERSQSHEWRGGQHTPHAGCLPCLEEQFQCGNCRCIQHSARCDHRNDCGDASDETDDCLYRTCSGHEFACTNQLCVAQQWVCDGTDDCGDGSDEIDCKMSACHPDEWACPHTGRCIPLSSVCDGEKDCPSGQDESDRCENSCTATSCEFRCHATPTGGHCYCRQGYQINPADNRTCEDFNECSSWGFCDQICENSPGSFHCSCHEGYALDPTNVCRAHNSEDMELIISSSMEILVLTSDGKRARKVLDGDIVDVDVDSVEELVYYINNTDKQVYSVSYRAKVAPTLIPLKGLAVPVDLALDWLTRSVYLVDRDTARIEMFNIPSGLQQNIVADNLQAPVAIALDPNTGYMFFADRGHDGPTMKPRIERVFMDGSHR